MIGQTLSHYKILEKLGEGGMGVVYKAEDTRLKRVVALKFLPPYISTDPDAKKRFIHEAQAASALQHLNICVVHDIDETDEGQMFISMEHLEGETIKKKIARGPLEVERVLDYALQVSQGLVEAHARGIVHRDVKPANVMITSHDVAKIVDFGLAKLSGVTLVTQTGSTIGTVAYMSPEQARGDRVDHRTDIWSLGVLIYEMVTGKLPFEGEYVNAVMYAIMNARPLPMTSLRTGVPIELERIVTKALEKDPDDRYQTVADLATDLRRLKRDTSKVSRVETSVLTVSPTGIKVSRWPFVRRRLLLVISLVAVAIGGIIAIHGLLSGQRLPELNPIASMRVIPLPMSAISYPSLSSDGNWIAFMGQDANRTWDLYFMNTSGGDVRRVTHDSGTGGEGIGGISRDGSQILYVANPRGRSSYIAVAPSLGGVSRKITEGFMPRWLRGETAIVYCRYDVAVGKHEIWTSRTDGSNARMSFLDHGPANAFNRYGSLSPSPDGKEVAWIRNFDDYTSEVSIRDLETAEERQLTHDRAQCDEVYWTAQNFIIYSSNRGGNFDLWMILPEGGEPVQLTRSAPAEVSAQLSGDGQRLLFYETQRLTRIRLFEIESGNVTELADDDANRTGAALSPDGNILAFVQAPPFAQPTTGITLQDRRTGRTWTIGQGERFWEGTPRLSWSPDGKWIAYTRLPNVNVAAADVCILSVFSDAPPRLLGRSTLVATRWLDQHTLYWHDGTKTLRSSALDSTSSQFYEDSTWAIPLGVGKPVFYADPRAGREGWWVDLEPSSPGRSRPGRRMILPLRFSARVSLKGMFLLYRDNLGHIRKVSLPDGKPMPLPGAVRDLPSDALFSLTPDESCVLVEEPLKRDRLVLLEKPFK